MTPLRREDLEVMTGISPIYSMFVASKKMMIYFHDDREVTLGLRCATFSEFIDEEARVCREAFK
jgi:hypothetical protein